MGNWELQTNRHINLFPKKRAPKKKVDDKAFDAMTAVSDKASVDIIDKGKKSSTKGIHTALLAAGMTPAYGNIADVADATLYALEGEFGEAAWSMAAAIPVIGQMVSGKRALRLARQVGGEGTVKLYRGVQSWERGKMVKEGRWVSPKELFGGGFFSDPSSYRGGKQPTKRGIWATENFDEAKEYAKYSDDIAEDAGKMGGEVLEFEVPKSWFDKKVKEASKRTGYGFDEWIDKGIPKEFLVKVHKAKEYVDPYVRGEGFSPY